MRQYRKMKNFTNFNVNIDIVYYITLNVKLRESARIFFSLS